MVILIDGKELANLMIELNVGVTPINTYTVKKLDGDYFEEKCKCSFKTAISLSNFSHFNLICINVITVDISMKKILTLVTLVAINSYAEVITYKCYGEHVAPDPIIINTINQTVSVFGGYKTLPYTIKGDNFTWVMIANRVPLIHNLNRKTGQFTMYNETLNKLMVNSMCKPQ